MVVANRRIKDWAYEEVRERRIKNPKDLWYLDIELVRDHDEACHMLEKRSENIAVRIQEAMDNIPELRFGIGDGRNSVRDATRFIRSIVGDQAEDLGPHGKVRIYADAIQFLDGSTLIGTTLSTVNDLYPDSDTFRRLAVKGVLQDLEPALRLAAIKMSGLKPSRYAGPEDFFLFELERDSHES